MKKLLAAEGLAEIPECNKIIGLFRLPHTMHKVTKCVGKKFVRKALKYAK